MNRIINHRYIFLVLAMSILVLVKIPHLGFPFSWDEAWSYYLAILKMTETGPTLLPGTIDIGNSRGHPLLFYFIMSVWVKLMPEAIFLVRMVPLLISVLVLIAFHRLLAHHVGILAANLSVIILSVQSLFLAQASLVLPEMLLTLFLILSLHAFLTAKYWLFALWATLMVLTKETGVFLTGVFGLIYLAENRKTFRERNFWTNGVIMAIPLFVYGLFLVLHNRAYGTPFFNEHLDYIANESGRIISKLRSASSNLATRYGRNTLSAAALISIAVLAYGKQKPENLRFFTISAILIVSLITFSIFNFFTHRYILPVLPLFIALCMGLTLPAFRKRKWLVYAVSLIIFSATLFYSVTKMGKIDNDLGYTQYLKVHKELVHWCETNNKYNSRIAAGYNMVLALRDGFNGYLTTEKGFKVNHLPKTEGIDILVWDSTCMDAERPEGFPDGWEKVFATAYKKHWGEIYIRKPYN